MKARDIQIQDVPIPELGDDGVLVDVKVATICHTDVIIRSGALTVNIPVTLGHEGAGVVAKVESKVKGVREGDRVSPFWAVAGVNSICLGRSGVIKSRLNYLKKEVIEKEWIF